MNEGKILLVKLSTQLPSVTSLIGSMLIALILNAAPARPAHKRRQFHLYADEFQRFTTEDFATLLEEARKYGIGVSLAHQNRGQLDAKNSHLEIHLKDRTRSVANLVVFKVNSKDATELAGEFDITPEEAWVEELEEEWIEEIEKEEVIGIKPVQTYKRDVVGHLFRQGHEDARVMAFVKECLEPLYLDTTAEKKRGICLEWNSERLRQLYAQVPS